MHIIQPAFFAAIFALRVASYQWPKSCAVSTDENKSYEVLVLNHLLGCKGYKPFMLGNQSSV